MPEDMHQRIKYLVEHGGLYDDPVDDIRRRLKWLTIAASVLALVVTVALIR